MGEYRSEIHDWSSRWQNLHSPSIVANIGDRSNGFAESSTNTPARFRCLPIPKNSKNGTMFFRLRTRLDFGYAKEFVRVYQLERRMSLTETEWNLLELFCYFTIFSQGLFIIESDTDEMIEGIRKAKGMFVAKIRLELVGHLFDFGKCRSVMRCRSTIDDATCGHQRNEILIDHLRQRDQFVSILRDRFLRNAMG